MFKSISKFICKNKENEISNYRADITGLLALAVLILDGNKIIKEIKEKYNNAYYIDFNDILCSPNCVYQDGKHSLYMDTGHLSDYGSNYLGEKYL